MIANYKQEGLDHLYESVQQPHTAGFATLDVEMVAADGQKGTALSGRPLIAIACDLDLCNVGQHSCQAVLHS